MLHLMGIAFLRWFIDILNGCFCFLILLMYKKFKKIKIENNIIKR